MRGTCDYCGTGGGELLNRSDKKTIIMANKTLWCGMCDQGSLVFWANVSLQQLEAAYARAIDWQNAHPRPPKYKVGEEKWRKWQEMIVLMDKELERRRRALANA